MRTWKFHSPLAEQIVRFIKLRRLSGTDYKSQTLLLRCFDRFLVKQGLAEPRINRDLVERYQESLSRLVSKTQHNHFCVVRQLCAYLSRTDSLGYVPERLRSLPAQPARQPYIYSVPEMRALMTAAAELPPAQSLRPHTYQTLLGLLYSTGIRIGEALALNLEDFHNADQRLYIAEGKFRKARWVPLSSSCNRALQKYVRRRLRTPPRSLDSPLFLNLRMRRLHRCMVHTVLLRLLRQCGIPSNGHIRPRIHDFRHAFAMRRLLAWYRDGLDVNTRLPWLTTYMGHVSIHSTRVYLRATAELLEQVDRRFHSYYLNHVKPPEDEHGTHTSIA